MRWSSDPNPEPRDGDTRFVTKFLWWPATIQGKDGSKETRWLERASIEQEYRFACFTEITSRWINKRFVNIEEERLKNV